MKRSSVTILGTACFLLAGAALGADPNAGKTLFAQRCSVCHTAAPGDNGGAQGPSLIGLVGRAAGTAPQFSYTAALRNSKLTWDPQTLKRFLAAPTSVVPGTSMLIAVPSDTERDDLIAYFQSSGGQASPAAAAAAAVPASSVQSANWRLDAPGRAHHISAASLPPPFETPSSRNNVSVVTKPA